MLLTIEALRDRVSVCRVEDGKCSRRFDLAAGGDLEGALEALAGAGLDGADAAVAAAPELGQALTAAVERLTGKKPLVVGRDGYGGLAVCMDGAGEADGGLAAAAAGALGRYRLPCVLIRVGEELAVAALDGKGSYRGELLCPGVPPGAALPSPERLLGLTRRECGQNGLVYGMAAMIDGLVTRVETVLGQQATVVLFGPGARDILPHCHRNQNAITDDDIVMRGLWRIWSGQ